MAFRGPKRGRKGQEDRIVLDKQKTLGENLREVLNVTCRPEDDSKEGGKEAAGKRLGYMEAMARLLQQTQTGSLEDERDRELGLRLKEVMMCLRLPLTSSSEELRASSLKVVRYLVRSREDVKAVTQVNLHHLIVRSLDLDPDNRAERIQAIKLARKLLVFGAPGSFPVSLVRCLVAILTRGESSVSSLTSSKQSGARSGGGASRDELWRSALAILCEVSLLDTPLFLTSGLARVLTSSLLELSSMPRLAEAVIASLLRLYTSPRLREMTGLNLSYVVSPYTELPHSDQSDQVTTARLECAATALLCLLRSWPGLLHLTAGRRSPAPHLNTCQAPCRGPLASLLDTLYLPSYQARRAILDLLYRSLNIQVHDWTDEFDVAIKAADPSSPRPEWRLGEGFTAAEGNDILPHLGKSRPNLSETQTALLLSSYLQCGLSSALIEVIVTGDTVLSVQAAILLGQFLHLVSSLVPHEVSSTQHCLPQLASYVDTSQPLYTRSKSTKALTAVTALHKLHAVRKMGPRPWSLLLEQVMEYSGHSHGDSGFVGDRLKLTGAGGGGEAGAQSSGGSGSAAETAAAIKETGVTTHRDPQSWRWDLVLGILKWPGDSLRRLEDSTCKLFIKKLTDFYLPSSNMFSRLELESAKIPDTRYLARVGQSLLDFLLSSLPISLPSSAQLATQVSILSNTSLTSQTGQGEAAAGGQMPEAGVRLDSLLADIMVCVQEVISSGNPHNAVFSPTRLQNTACQLYFLLLGRLSRSDTGRSYLDRHNVISLLGELLHMRHDVYLKLVITALDYRHEDWGARAHLLVKGLTGVTEAGRVYTTRWLGVLARLGVPNIAVYGVELLVRQLLDESLTVASTALDILDEVCDDKMFLESLVSHSALLLSPAGQLALARLADRGRLLVSRCVGSAYGFSLMTSNSWLSGELSAWAAEINTRYVMVVEAMINEGFSLHQRGESGHGVYGRRSAASEAGSGEARERVRVMVPPHLYGQLAATRQGLELLLGEATFWELVTSVLEAGQGQRHAPTDVRDRWTEAGLVRLKAAIWGVANAATSPSASKILDQRGVIGSLVSLAESCPHLAIAGTAYYALGLVATTAPGSEALGRYGWATIRHSRGQTWPIATDWLQLVPGPATRSEGGASVVSEDEEELEIVRTNTASSDTGTVVLAAVKQSPSGKKMGLDKIASWFKGSADSGDKRGSVGSSNGGKSGKAARRNSEGSKGSSSGLASRFRKSFRDKRASLGSGGRPRTTSVGSLPSKENTPLGSLNVTGESVLSDSQPRRKLSFSQDTEVEAERTETGMVAASPGADQLPGEMFMLDNITEEPDTSRETGARELMAQSVSTSSSGVSYHHPVRQQESVPGEHHATSAAITISPGQTGAEEVPSLETVGSKETGSVTRGEASGVTMRDLSVVSPPIPDIVRSVTGPGETSLLGVIRQGTSVSSVSSIGSYSFTENPGYSTRTRKHRRPQLSESEDGDTSASLQPGGGSLNFGRSSHTLPGRGRGQGGRGPVDIVERCASVPPAKNQYTLPRPDIKESSGQYWGLAFPLNPQVLLPSEPAVTAAPPPACDSCPMPLQLSRLYTNSQYQHDPGQCLKCYDVKVSSRPRSSSLTASAVSVSDLGPPDLRRQSCFSLSLLQQPEAGAEAEGDKSPSSRREAACEALRLISCLNNPIKAKVSEAGLVKLQRKCPDLFSDLCFYADVCGLLASFQFRASSRRFIQELFIELNFDQMYSEAVKFLENQSK